MHDANSMRYYGYEIPGSYGYQRGELNMEKPAVIVAKKRSCTRYICCPCCICLPHWMRCICCFFLLTILALVGLAVFLATQIKVPQVDFNGIANHPAGLPHFIQTDTHSFDINIGLNIGVVNPNMASVAFEKIKATAFYPTSPSKPVGGGELSDLVINAHAATNFTFPFEIHYDHSKDEEQKMLLDIMQKCGFTGGPKEDLVIQYILTPTIRIIGFPLSIAIKNSVSLPCPPLDSFEI